MHSALLRILLEIVSWSPLNWRMLISSASVYLSIIVLLDSCQQCWKQTTDVGEDEFLGNCSETWERPSFHRRCSEWWDFTYNSNGSWITLISIISHRQMYELQHVCVETSRNVANIIHSVISKFTLWFAVEEISKRKAHELWIRLRPVSFQAQSFCLNYAISGLSETGWRPKRK